MVGTRCDPPDLTSIGCDGRAARRQLVNGSIEVHQRKTAGRVAQVVHTRDSLLAAITTLRQVDGRSDPTDFMRQCPMISLEANTRNSRRYAECIPRPRARPRGPLV